MDGGEKQVHMAQAIRAQVKHSSGLRRRDTQGFQVGVFSSRDKSHKPNSSTPETPSSTLAGPPQGPDSTAAISSTQLSALNETENFLVTLYLDTVFPFLFPAYKPAILSGGRSWLLSLLKSNKAVFHSAMSVAAYYFTLMLAKDASHTLQTPCEQHVWDSLAKHVDLSMAFVRQDIADFSSRSLSTTNISRNLGILQSVAGLLIFETAMAKGADWESHLSAALAVLGDILQIHGLATGDGRCNLISAVLFAMHNQPNFFDGIRLGFPIWNVDQASFQFYAAFLIYADVISSVCLRAAPRLDEFHADLLGSRSPLDCTKHVDDGRYVLEMEQFIGCQGWVILCISEISSWERKQRQATRDNPRGQVDGWTTRCAELEYYLHNHLAKSSESSLSPTNDSIKVAATLETDLVTSIWIYSALIYLSAVNNGWRNVGRTAMTNIESILTVVQSLSPLHWLRSIIWPVFVAGCAASSEPQQDVFRNLFASLGPLQRFGTAREALSLMEQAWKLGDRVGDSWQLADFLQGDMTTYLII